MEPSEAIQVGKALAACNLLWLEEAVPRTFHDELERVSNNVPMPTASAEAVFSLEGFRPFLTGRLVDVLMPDVKHVGGLRETINVAHAARLGQFVVAPHNPSGPVACVASGHVCATMTNFLILEYAWGEVDWRADLLDPRERIEGGFLVLSDAPGLGCKLNPAMVEAHRAARPSPVDSTKVVISA